jgi:hypothetical protein
MDVQLAPYVGIGVIAVILVVSVITAYSTGHSKGLQAGVEAGSKALETAFNNPTYLQLAKGASENIPQGAFNKYLAVSAAAQTWTPDWVDIVLQRLDDVVKKIDHDPANDPANEATPAAEREKELVGVG